MSSETRTGRRRIRPLAALAFATVLAGTPAAAGDAGHQGVRATLDKGGWLEVPDSRLIDVAPSRSPGGATLKIVAWSGAALDTRRSQLLVWGGGHSDYAGNEVYAFDLRSLQWRRLTEPSVADRGRTATYPDGQPRARHTYNYIEYVPALDRMLVFGASGPYPGGGGEFSRSVIEFDIGERRWITGGRADVPPPGNLIGAQARIDPESGRVYVIGSQKAALLAYDPAADRWSQLSPPTRVRVHATAAIDPGRRELVLIGSGGRSGGQALRWKLDAAGEVDDVSSRTTGDKQVESAYGPGFDYDSRRRRLVAWAGGSEVFVFDGDSLRWTRIPAPADSANPGPPNPTGTYGRFRYVADHDAFVLVNAADRNVFMYRLPAKFL
jgi:hypothetical protein